MPIVRDILARKGNKVLTVTQDATVLQAAEKMNEHRVGAVCVVEGDRVLGMFTERDVLCRIVAQRRDPAGTRVADVMTHPVVTCVPSAKVEDCALAMSTKRIRHLPVVESDGSGARLVGLISTGDLVALEVVEKQAHIEHLHEYLNGLR
jgi:CBS domain-containing protein